MFHHGFGGCHLRPVNCFHPVRREPGGRDSPWLAIPPRHGCPYIFFFHFYGSPGSCPHWLKDFDFPKDKVRCFGMFHLNKSQEVQSCSQQLSPWTLGEPFLPPRNDRYSSQGQNLNYFHLLPSKSGGGFPPYISLSVCPQRV